MKEVILTEDIRAIGRAGEVVKVSDGYARNYLIPQRKGLPATAGNLKRLEADREAMGRRREKQKEESTLLATKLRTIKVVLHREVGEENRLFGQVTTRQIAEALAAQGVSLDPRLFRLREPIRSAGSHTVEVYLQGDVVAELTVEVEKR